MTACRSTGARRVQSGHARLARTVPVLPVAGHRRSTIAHARSSEVRRTPARARRPRRRPSPTRRQDRRPDHPADAPAPPYSTPSVRRSSRPARCHAAADDQPAGSTAVARRPSTASTANGAPASVWAWITNASNSSGLATPVSQSASGPLARARIRLGQATARRRHERGHRGQSTARRAPPGRRRGHRQVEDDQQRVLAVERRSRRSYRFAPCNGKARPAGSTLGERVRRRPVAGVLEVLDLDHHVAPRR